MQPTSPQPTPRPSPHARGLRPGPTPAPDGVSRRGSRGGRSGAPVPGDGPRRRVAAGLTAVSAAVMLAIAPGDAQIAHADIPTPDVCPGAAPAAGSLAGVVRGSLQGRPLEGAVLVLTGDGIPDVGAVTDSAGTYHFCALPPGGSLHLEARFGQWVQGPLQLRIEQGIFHRQDFVVGPGTGEFVGDEGKTRQGRVLGAVRDLTNGEPIVEAHIEVPELGRTALTDREGRFVLPDIRPGDRTVRIRHVAYGTTEHTLRVPESATATLSADLAPEAIEMEPILVAGIRSRWLERHGFYERKETGGQAGAGSFISAEEIEAQNPGLLTSFLNSYPSVEVRCSGGGHNSCRLRFSATVCEQAVIYVDGVRSPGFTIDELVIPSEVAGVELYRGVSELPGEFADPVSRRCGAVVLWTKAGG